MVSSVSGESFSFIFHPEDGGSTLRDTANHVPGYILSFTLETEVTYPTEKVEAVCCSEMLVNSYQTTE
jgi:hypothetical protein